MKLLIAVDAPTFGRNTATPRAAQWERTGIGNMLRLLATRIEFGQAEGTMADGGTTLHWKIEQSAPADGEQAA